MATTSKGFRYPVSTDTPNVPRDIGYLASDVDNWITNNPITINGTPVSLGGTVTISGLPSQSGNNGKYLTTDGSSASWVTINLSSYAPLNSPTFTGTVSGITATMVGLGNVNNTSDANKPISSATQTALDAKVNLSGATMTGLLVLSADPSTALGAATKQYVDSKVEGLAWKPAVNLLVDSNIANLADASGTYDGHPVGQTQSGYRLFLKGQTTASENGIYVAAWVSGKITLYRPADSDTYQELIGASIFVEEGTTYAKTTWVQSNHYLTSFAGQVWTQTSGVGTFTAGNGLALSGTQFSINTAITADLSTAQSLTNKTMSAASSSTIGLIVKGTTSQSANIQEWQDSTGSVKAWVNSAGVLNALAVVGTYNSYFYAGASGAVPIKVVGAVSQTANLQEWQNNAGTVLASISNNGGLFIKPTSGTGNLLKFEAVGNTYGWSVPASNPNAIVFDVNTDPRIYWGSNMIWTMESTPNSSVFRPYTLDRYAMTLKGIAGQTADLMQFQTSAGTTLAKVDKDGNITAPSLTLSTTGLATTSGGTGITSYTTGDIVYASATNTLSKLGIGSNGQVLTLTSGLPTWANAPTGFTNPMTTAGDIIIGGSLGAATRLAAGTNGYVLTMSSGSPAWVAATAGYTAPTIGSTSISSGSTVTTIAGLTLTSPIINPSSASATSLIVKGAASQTANLQEWQDSAGTVIASVSSSGAFISNSSFLTGGTLRGTGSLIVGGTTGISNVRASIYTNSTTTVGLVIQGSASQTANLQEWQNSAGAALSYINSSGNLYVGQSSGGQISFGGGNGRTLQALQNGAQANFDFYANQTYFNSDFLIPSGKIISTANGDTGNLNITTNSSAAGIQTNRYLVVGGSSNLAQITAYALSSTTKGLVVQGTTSQTANLQEWQNNSGTVLAKITAAGAIDVTAITVNGAAISTSSIPAASDVELMSIMGAY